MLRPDQKLIMVYPDPSEFSQWQPDVAIGSQTISAMTAIAAALDGPPPAERVAWRDAVHQQEVDFAVPGEITPEPVPHHGYERSLRLQLPPLAVLVIGPVK